MVTISIFFFQKLSNPGCVKYDANCWPQGSNLNVRVARVGSARLSTQPLQLLAETGTCISNNVLYILCTSCTHVPWWYRHQIIHLEVWLGLFQYTVIVDCIHTWSFCALRLSISYLVFLCPEVIDIRFSVIIVPWRIFRGTGQRPLVGLRLRERSSIILKVYMYM